jgi:CDP-glucose 4,6-dehydratase
MSFNNQFKNRTVLLTGHTGFKGSWISQWLLMLGAKVHGLALDPKPEALLFDQLDLGNKLTSDTRLDIRDKVAVRELVTNVQPDFVFHLAAQPIVRLSYDIPVETFETNVMGTVHLLDALRNAENVGAITTPCATVVVTTDKCYENREWQHAYREEDAMGGFDPYSASKGCTELVVSAYRRSYFESNSLVRLSSARAGNVIGGGDWATDRIIPDCFRAIGRGEPIEIRNRTSTRPWQHVLEPLSGYLWLAARLASESSGRGIRSTELQSAFNFGPPLQSNRTVADVVNSLLQHVPGTWVDRIDKNAKHEAGRLNLAIDKAYHLLDWKPVWDFERTIAETAHWYREVSSGRCAELTTSQQIKLYCRDALQSNIAWASQSL